MTGNPARGNSIPFWLVTSINESLYMSGQSPISLWKWLSMVIICPPSYLFLLDLFIYASINIAYLKIFTVNRFKYHISMIGLFFPRARESMISMLYQDRLQIPNRIPVPSFPDVPQDPNTDFAWEQRTGAWPTTGGAILDLWGGRFDGGCYNYYSNGYNHS